MQRPVAPTREDGVARAASEVLGGPLGRHAGPGPGGAWSAPSVLALLAVPTLVLAVLTRQPCRVDGFASPGQFTNACYSDLPALFVSSGLDRGVVPYLQSVDGVHLAQPVGTGGLLALLAWLAPGGSGAPTWVFDVGVLLLALALVVTVLAVAALADRRPWDAALVALSPVVVVAGLVSLDLVAVALATLGTLALARHRPVAAGVLLGLAVAVRPVALVPLVALWLLSVRTGRYRATARATGAALLAWGLVNLPVLAVAPQGWAAYWSGVLDAPAGYGGLWLLPGLAGSSLPPATVRWGWVVGLVVVLLLVALATLGTRRRPRLPAVVVLLLVGVFVVAPSVPVQASLWLLPFAALAVPRWRDHLVWGGVEVAYATGTWLYLYGLSVPERGLAPWAYGVLLVARLAAMGWLARQALSAAREPHLDPVRTPRDAPGLSRDDPAAGDLEGAADAVVVRVT
ncbi:MAG: glycosyltransferase 87 family protein [Actinomycetes bacterium]